MTAPTCQRLGGCAPKPGVPCAYCGAWQPIPTIARTRLAALIAYLQHREVKT